MTDQEVLEVKNFIKSLNAKTKSAVIVEGIRDSAALKKLGFTGKILEFHKFNGITKFADSAAEYQNLIVLFDRDRKGRYLTGKLIEHLQRRTNIDLSFKRRLVSITKGKIRFIEELKCYDSFLEP